MKNGLWLKFAQKIVCATLILIFLGSCTKEKMSGTNGITDSLQSSGQSAGGIVDMGVVNGDLHHMSVSLSEVMPISYTGLKKASPTTNSRINFEIFSRSDGIINDGTYYFSSITDHSPFTFKSGNLYMPTLDNTILNTYEVSGGTITVVRNGGSYSINIESEISNGGSFTGYFNGPLSYMDTTVFY